MTAYALRLIYLFIFVMIVCYTQIKIICEQKSIAIANTKMRYQVLTCWLVVLLIYPNRKALCCRQLTQRYSHTNTVNFITNFWYCDCKCECIYNVLYMQWLSSAYVFGWHYKIPIRIKFAKFFSLFNHHHTPVCSGSGDGKPQSFYLCPISQLLYALRCTQVDKSTNLRIKILSWLLWSYTNIDKIVTNSGKALSRNTILKSIQKRILFFCRQIFPHKLLGFSILT